MVAGIAELWSPITAFINDWIRKLSVYSKTDESQEDPLRSLDFISNLKHRVES